MFRTLFSAVSFGATLAMAMPAVAVSLTNRDERPYKVTFIEGETRTEQALAPGGVLEGVCLAGCVLRLDDNETEEYELEGFETVSIEAGVLYYDGPDAPAETPPAQGEPGRPPTPKR